MTRVPTTDPGAPGTPPPRDRAPASGPGRLTAAAGLLRLVHPFPSLLDATATFALALLAGGTPLTAASLGASMLLLQFAIGATNDLADASLDAVARPGKPIPSGAVSRRVAVGVATTAAVAGLGLAGLHGTVTFAIAALGLGVGLVYDLVLKPTPLSWLPYAVGIPLVPAFAWAGAAGSIPPAVVLLALLAIPAGAGIAVANALADLDGDRDAGARTIATVLGHARAWGLATALLAGTWAAAVVALVALGALPGGDPPAGSAAGPGGAPSAGDPAAWGGLVAVIAAAVLIAAGAWLGRGQEPSRRRVGWGIEAVGVVVLGCGWVAVTQAAGLLGP